MAKKERNVVVPEGTGTKALNAMSAEMHGHLATTALRAGHGHLLGHQGGHEMPDSDAHKQAGAFIPQRVFAGPSQVSQGGFQQDGAQGAEYETTSSADTPDADSTGPTGY
jgi:hypothetical protein